MIFTGASKKYQKSINSKFAKLVKYNKFNFTKCKIMILYK